MAKFASKIALGTAQWGMQYGIANNIGIPKVSELEMILSLAATNSIRCLDTARSYGQSEQSIGQLLNKAGKSFRLVSKIDPAVFREDYSNSGIIANTELSLATTIANLSPTPVDTILLHRGAHRTVRDGLIWKYLLKAKSENRFQRLGISAANPTEAMEALEDSTVEVIQVASSLLDQRLRLANFFEKAASQNVEIHVRSIFLQGVAHMRQEDLPIHLNGLVPDLMRIKNYASTIAVKPSLLWLQYAMSLNVKYLLLGVEKCSQLEENLEQLRYPIIEELESFRLTLKENRAELLDSSLWKVS